MLTHQMIYYPEITKRKRIEQRRMLSNRDRFNTIQYLRKMLVIVALRYLKDETAFTVETYFMVWQGKITGPITNCMEAIRVRISCYLEKRKRIGGAPSTTS